MNENDLNSLDASADADILALQKLQQQATAAPQQNAHVSVQVGEEMPFAGAPTVGSAPSQPQHGQAPTTAAPYQTIAPVTPQNPAVAQPDPMVQLQMQQMQQQQLQLTQQLQQMTQLVATMKMQAQAGQNIEPQKTGIDSVLDKLRNDLNAIPDEYDDTMQMKQTFLSAIEGLAAEVQSTATQNTMEPAAPMASAAPILDDGYDGQLTASHPDWGVVVHDPLFNQWCQIDQERSRIDKAGSLAEVVWLITEFKRARASGGLLATLQQAAASAQPAGYQQPHHVAQNPTAAPLPSLHSHANGAVPQQPSNGQQPLLSESALMQSLTNPNDRYGQDFAKIEDQLDAALLAMGNLSTQ